MVAEEAGSFAVGELNVRVTCPAAWIEDEAARAQVSEPLRLAFNDIDGYIRHRIANVHIDLVCHFSEELP